MKYEPTIGLEIHAELKTVTKMFCDSPNNPDEKHPNVNVCPVCLGHPGTLPVINKDAVSSVIKVGIALGGTINKITKFDRKNYFYPDLPKGYQISQYDQPLVIGGKLNDIRLRRIHLEEDTGRLIHELQGNGLRSMIQDSSLVDFNRAGVPLMEIVTEPDIKSAEEAMKFAKELQLILRYLEVSDADMEKGHMRIEANVSLNAGTKVEVKNINSFRAVGEAIKTELERQEKLLKKGEKVKHETRGWNETKKTTVSQRSKEEAKDYRYFPEPDLPPFETDSFDLEALRVAVPELPKEKRVRFAKEFNLDPDRVEILVSDMDMSNFFEEAVSELQALDPKLSIQMLFNYLTSDLLGLIREAKVTFKESKINPEHLAHLISLIDKGRVLSRGAKDILKKMFETGFDPEAIMESEDLGTISNKKDLEKTIKEVIAEQEKAVADYKKGKEASLKFMVGTAMGKLKGRGDPKTLEELFKKALK